jgi:RNA polymerase-binding transcription factor DksA
MDKPVGYNEYDLIKHKSYSMIKTFANSKDVYKYVYLDEIRKEPTAAMEFGSALHKYVLEFGNFYNEYYTDTSISNLSKKTKEYKEKLEELEKENQGKTFIKAEDYKRIVDISDMLHQDEYVSSLLLDFEDNERKLMAEIDGRLYKGTPDKYSVEKGIIIDLKTCSDPSSFEKDANKYGYFIQQSLYKKLCETNYSKPFNFIFIVVPVKEPYYVELYTYDSINDEIAWDYICEKYDQMVEYEKVIHSGVKPKNRTLKIMNISQWCLK